MVAGLCVGMPSEELHALASPLRIGPSSMGLQCSSVHYRELLVLRLSEEKFFSVRMGPSQWTKKVEPSSGADARYTAWTI